VNNWNALRDHYRRVSPLIQEEQKNEWAIDPYAWDELNSDGRKVMEMTPIESSLWADIRQLDAVFYPQFPVGKFFVDFANPRAKIAIECDGLQYHLDKAKDAARDAKLAELGWQVYRITGRKCNTDFDEEKKSTSAAYKFVFEIASRHGLIRRALGHPED